MDSQPLFRWFLSHGASLNTVSDFETIPLNVAAEQHDLATVRLLVENNADIKASNAVQAAAGGKSPDRLEIVTYLLDKGADVNAFEYNYHEKGFRYHAALKLPPTRDPDDKIVGAATALHRAVEMGRKDLIHALLRREADPSLRMRGLSVENKYTKEEIWRTVSGMTAIEIAES